MGRSGLGQGAALVLVLWGLPSCGVFTQQKEFDSLASKNQALEQQVELQQREIVAVKSDLEATRQRLENALRANADTGSDVLSSKARLNDLAGRFDEIAHRIEEVQRDVGATRTEIDARVDELKRTLAAQQTPAPPPVQIPTDKPQHWKELEAASTRKDWGLVRTLGHEYVTRYPGDDRADDALYLVADGNLQDNKPSSALGELNRILKHYPRSDLLDRTLFLMGEAYLLLHDCENAKLAFSAVESRYGKQKIGAEAKQRVARIDKPPPGLCAPH